MKYILFTGGGSAGHVVPNLAIMNELKYSCRIGYVGTSGVEKTLVEKNGYPFTCIECPKLQRKLTLQNLKIPFSLKKAVDRAEEILREDTPDLVFSKGGYASYPTARAAQKLHIPVFTHESDLSLGLCTKLLAKRCEKVLTSFSETAEKLKNGLYVGSPIRKEIFNGDKLRALHKYDFSGEKPVLLILGGGGGSKTINDFVRKNLDILLKEFEILHLCGKNNQVVTPYHGYVQREFEADMGSAYACADVVMARAGSNTVFEILALKKTALFVPLAKSSRGDQIQNALYFSSRGLCKTLPETQLDESGISTLTAIKKDKKLHATLSDSAIESGTKNIVSLLKKRLCI